MSVATNESNDWFDAKHREKCATCKRHLHYPFVHWLPGFCLCGKCVQDIKRGLIADLIHCEAIKNLQDLGYGEETFTREAVCAAENRLKNLGKDQEDREQIALHMEHLRMLTERYDTAIKKMRDTQSPPPVKPRQKGNGHTQV